jgi:ABC-type Zn uptake system ZnuABC Zn-binding protein ZnuA
LFVIKFSTGSYIFGDDYHAQQDLFKKFFDELKTYKPNYSDTHNSGLYWTLNNSKEIVKNFKDIFTKYQDINKSELNQRKADRLRKELAKLEG